MSRLPLAIALIAAQLLCWGGAPLYVCLACDGSVRLDGGPENCGCRHDEDADLSDSCHAGQAACQHRHDDEPSTCASSERLHEQVCDACGCLHIRISHWQLLTISAAHRLSLADLAPVLSVEPIALEVQTAVVTSTAGSRATRAEPTALAALASVILRC